MQKIYSVEEKFRFRDFVTAQSRILLFHKNYNSCRLSFFPTAFLFNFIYRVKMRWGKKTGKLLSAAENFRVETFQFEFKFSHIDFLLFSPLMRSSRKLQQNEFMSRSQAATCSMTDRLPAVMCMSKRAACFSLLRFTRITDEKFRKYSKIIQYFTDKRKIRCQRIMRGSIHKLC